jgi:hypothetical protein
MVDLCLSAAAVHHESVRELHVTTLRTEAQHARKKIEKRRGFEAARWQTEPFKEVKREGIWQATTASKAAADGGAPLGLVVCRCCPGDCNGMARYTEEVMRHTSEASQALLFLAHSAGIAEAASRMTMRSFDALGQTSAEQTRP